MPSPSESRPSRCCGCGAASRPHGALLVVHGDGTRERQVRGPVDAQGRPELGTVRVRRFECQRCGACMVVMPRELLPRRLYTASAIGLALALWSLMGATEAATRVRVSPFAIVGVAAATRWMTLRRWATDAGAGRLFATSRAPPSGFVRRQHAERAAAALVALAPAGLPLEQAAFVGGALHFR
jgi:ferredoxin